MKRTLFVLGLAMAAVHANAQHESRTQGHNTSAFDGYSRLPMNKQAMAATQAKMLQVMPGFHATTDKLTGAIRDAYGKAMTVPGATLEEKSAYILNNKLTQFQVNAADWQKTNTVNAAHAGYTHYEQVVSGHKVAFSQLMFRFTTGGQLERIVMKTYGTPAANAAPAINNADAYNVVATKESLADITISSIVVEKEWEWFPVPAPYKYNMVPAWPFNIKGTDKKTNMPVDLAGYLDAVNGEIIYAINEVKEETNVVVKGNVLKDGFMVPATIEPLANLEVTISGSTVYTNDTGFAEVTGINPPQSTSVELQGKWSTVRHLTVGGTIPTFNTNITTNGGPYMFPTTSPSSDAHVNAYYHTDRMHEFMKKFYPTTTGFTQLDISLPTVVDLVDATGCNAFYNGNSINFYAENGSCNSFAKIADIVYHEYGHGINGKFYNFIKGSGNMRNGGLNEGYADVWAMSLTKDPILGKGAFKSGSNIRTYGSTPKVYPMDRTSEVHDNGEIIAGSWWEVGTNWGHIDSMTMLFAKTLFDVPDGPEGTEGEVFHEVLISALLNDDDDANLSNGTPHFQFIVPAFAKHGIYLFSDAQLDHKEIDNRSSDVDDIPVQANITTVEPAYFGSMKLVYRVRPNFTWDTLTMTNSGPGSIGGINFDIKIPKQGAGSIIDYYFITYDMFGSPAYTFPTGYNTNLSANQLTIPYQFAVGVYKRGGTDFDTQLGSDWQIGTSSNETATSGNWEQVKPVASYWAPNGTSTKYMQQTDADHTSGTGMCLVTGNAGSASMSDGTADVDNGKTYAVTPPLDLNGYNNPVIEYHRWYSNEWGPRNSNPRSDSWVVQMRDTGSSIWRPVENTVQSDVAWRRRIFRVREYLSNSTVVQLRFVASDDVLSGRTNNGQNTVEAAVDDLFIYDAWPLSVGSQPQRLDIKIYPNPADNTVNVSLPQGVDGTLSLFDVTGREIARQSMQAATTSYAFNTSGVPAGTYMLIIKTANSVQTTKVAVSH